MARLEAEVHGKQRGEAPEHQTRAEEQHDRERHLDGDERSAQALALQSDGSA